MLNQVLVRGRVVLLVLGVIASVACGTGAGKRGIVPAGTTEPDRFLFERGTEELNKKKWLTAREFFKQLVETYTQSVFRPDAKLGIGDTYLGEGSAEALVLAINEFREFLSFYPTNRRADYAQYKLGIAHYRQMRNPQRDQTETREAIKELQAFVDRYPNSELIGDGRAKLREAKDRLEDSDYLVGYFYFRIRWYQGAVERFKPLMSDDAYSNRDALYYYYAESLVKLNREAEALPLLERLVNEFEKSEYLPQAQKRIAELKATMAQNKPPGD